jgi:uncharacterized protein (TIGR04168 family)
VNIFSISILWIAPESSLTIEVFHLTTVPNAFSLIHIRRMITTQVKIKRNEAHFRVDFWQSSVSTNTRGQSMQQPLVARKETFRFAIIGDLHTYWDSVDLQQFASADHDLLFFTGDLGGGTQESSLRLARSMAQLRQPSLVMPGNNDTGDIDLLAAELAHQQGLSRLLSITRNTATPTSAIKLCGYSETRIRIGNREISLIAARPHSMGGPDLTFPDYMLENYNISSMGNSVERLVSLVDNAAAEIIFLSHNGPVGLGDEPDDMWGCDFKDDGGDWGDPDLAQAIGYARRSGKQVSAVIAGHMHLRTKQGVDRPWLKNQDGTLFINAARVPRIFSDKDNAYRHHVLLTISEDDLQAEEVLMGEYT